MTGHQGKRQNVIEARARADAVLAMTIDAIHAGEGPLDRPEAARKLKCTIRMVEWAIKCLVRQGRLSIEGYAANHRHHVPGVGATAWSFGRPPQPRPAHKIAKAEGRPPPEKPETLPFSMSPIRGSNWTARTCRWVVGDVTRFVGAEFCEQPVVLGSSYCSEHHARCFVRGSRDRSPMEINHDPA